MMQFQTIIKYVLVITIFLGINFPFFCQNSIDVIKLKDGTQQKGTILTIEEDFIKIKLLNGEVANIGTSQIKTLDKELMYVDEIEEVDESNILKAVPFAVIEIPPVFQGCEVLKDRKEQKQCTSNSLQKFVSENFNRTIAEDIGLSGKIRISAQFEISDEGLLTNIRARAPHPRLEKEAIRVLNLVPPLTPGKQDGETVICLYALPILFTVN
ncbi:MAG: energy transducer TonB [Flavobacteriaceae bacterium]|nr:hypothetical protein [Flavobacteriaceae bacterium]